jgi:hypothetical protein
MESPEASGSTVDFMEVVIGPLSSRDNKKWDVAGFQSKWIVLFYRGTSRGKEKNFGEERRAKMMPGSASRMHTVANR